jgi:hypothetical protein
MAKSQAFTGTAMVLLRSPFLLMSTSAAYVEAVREVYGSYGLTQLMRAMEKKK